MYKVIKPFSFADDGINIKKLNVGEVVSVPANVVQGLIDDGFLEAPQKEKPQKAKEKGVIALEKTSLGSQALETL